MESTIPNQGHTAVTPSTKELSLETPVLQFDGVELDRSLALPIVVTCTGDSPITLEVLVPPLAPFSVASESIESNRRRRDDRQSRAELWIRYDATAPMAVDTGTVTIEDTQTRLQWTIELNGRAVLAAPHTYRTGDPLDRRRT